MAVEVGGTLHVVVSKGRNILLKDNDTTKWTDLAKGNNMTEEEARTLCIENEVTYEIHYKYDASRPNGYVIYAERWDNLTIKAGTYLPQDIILYIYINDLSMKH